jgi:orotate phosphoribosyltransferase-like protein
MKLITVQDLNEGDLVTAEVFSKDMNVSMETIRSWLKMRKRKPENYPRIIVIGKTTFISKSDFVRLCNRLMAMQIAS